MATLGMLGGLVGVSPAPGATAHGTILYEQTVDRWRTPYDEGTRSVSRNHTIIERSETVITVSPRNACTGQMHACTKEVEVRFR
jgi:hypothetical protein